ncbi:MAG: hypothetical protein NT009_03760 [Proteobacteria bacterium]|nr:hypothetical protein [Pseudomonadota bacterium]
MTDASIQALGVLRQLGHFEWYLVPLLAFVLYVYVVEIERKNWNGILVGLLFYAGEFLWEMINGLVLYFTQRSAIWTTPADSAYVILVGLNIEVSMMFFVAGLIVVKTLPADRNLKIQGLPNRILIPVFWGIFCTLVEVTLNRMNVLIWEYSWWRWPHIYIIIINYTAPFLLITWAYDRLTLKFKIRALGIFILVDVIAWIVFSTILKWI